VALAVVLTLAYTDPYGSLNQATYLLDPLRRAMPELFRRDWFVSETPPYLPAFGWLAQWLFRLDPEGPIAVLTAHVVVMLAIYAAIYWLVTSVCRDGRVFAIIASVTAMTMGRTLGGNYLITGYLQPSSISSLGWIVAMAALVRQRYLACGIALAVAGLMHANFLVLGFGLFLLAALARRDATRGDLLRLVLPQLVVVAYCAPDLLAASGPSATAVRVLVEFHAPGHYAPWRLARHLPELACWQLAAFAALPLFGDVAREARALWRFALLAFAISVATTFLMMIPSLAWLTQARWTRIAPFGQLACQVLVVGALLRYASAPALSLARRTWLAFAAVLAVYGTARVLLRRSMDTTLLTTGSVIAILGVPARFARYTATAVAALIVAMALWASPRGAGLQRLPTASPGELAMASWAQRETPVDAVFLTPPWLQRFRLLSRRAVVVDTKSPPLRPDLLVEWYRRMCAIVELADAKHYRLVEARWAELTPEQRHTVARRFEAEYIVVTADIAMPGTPVHRNDEYAVYRVER
jgi:hypothetical protein